MALVGLLLGWMVWRRRRDRARARWQGLCARLARAGLPRLPHEGPLAYAERAAVRWPQFDAALTGAGGAYALLRYGRIATRGDDDRERAAALARLERAIAALPAAASLKAQPAR